MSTRQYIGARYVPKFYDYEGSSEWRSGVPYEALTIVTRNGNSYTSKIPVPATIGNPESNPDYWVSTGIYNQQIEEYRQAALETKVELDEFIEEENLKTNCVTPQMYGAKADGETDDTAAIQAAINSGSNVMFPEGTYLVNSKINMARLYNRVVDAQSAIIRYTGSDYAIEITRADCTEFKFGYIFAPNGGGIKFISSNPSDHCQYDNVYFHKIECATNCIYGTISGDGWVNEIRVHDGQMAAGRYGVFLENKSSIHSMNQWSFINVGVEGVETGFKFDGTTYLISEILILGCRTQESFQHLIEAVGTVYTVTYLGTHPVHEGWLILNPTCVNWRFWNRFTLTNGASGLAASVYNGVIYLDDNQYVMLDNNYQLSEVDLNTFIQPGNYYVPYSTLASITNLPTEINMPFELKISSFSYHQYPRQTIKPYNSSATYERIGNADGSIWSPWRLIIGGAESYTDINAEVTFQSNKTAYYGYGSARYSKVELLYDYNVLAYGINVYNAGNNSGCTFVCNTIPGNAITLPIRVWA